MIIKFIKKKFNLIKICAVFITVCFVVSTLGANLYAIPLAENANKKYEDVFNKVSSISAEYGKITASKDANSDITIINIQDLHCHPQTQRNISKIITQIADNYNLKKIYVEGGYGDIDTSWLNTIKDEKIKRQIIEGLLEEGILTGSEYYKLTNNNEVELKGIDEEQIHKDNVRRLSWIIANQDKYKAVITKVEKEINILEKMHVNSRNERFNRDIEKYLTNEIDSRRFYRQLAKYVKDINENPDKYNNITAIRLEDYPNITKFIALRKTAKDIDVKEVTQQLQMVINELKNKLPYNVYTRLLSETENLSDSQKVVELITMLCNKEGINLENKYKSLHTFLESNGINRELNTVELVQEERQLLSEIRKALSYNNEEYEITFISDFSKYFKDYLEYKLTDADWKYFEKEFDQFITLYSKYATVNRIQEIYGDFEEINKYYKINDQRNNIFVSNLLKDEEISVSETDRVRQEEEILKNSKEVIIAVTGGFHSTELEEILAKKEVNTIVITPSIFEGIEKATKQYKGIIKEQSRYFQHQALAYTLASCTTDEYKKNLLYSMAKDLLGGNVERLREALGQDVDLTVFDNLQPLTEQEQEQISEQKNIIVSAASDIAADVLPKEGGKAIFVPNVSEIILKVSRSLVDAGIFLNNGPVFAAEELGLPNLDDISPEEYSRMPDSIQEALVAKEYGTEAESDERANEEENFAEESIDETEDVETLVEEETVDSSYLSEERKSELLKKLNNDREALDLLIDICCRKSVNFDLSKDSALLEMFIRKLNLGEDYLDFDYMYDIVRRSIHVANTFPIDTDLKFACFEKFIDFFNSEDKNKNGEVYYITLFRRLFSLNKKSLQFFYETLDGLSANDLVFYYDASKINKNLKFLLENFDKGIYEITDYSRLVNLFDNIDKLSFLSEGEFSYLISLPNKIFVSILYSSKDSFQLKTKLTVGKKYYYKGCDEDVARAIFDKAEKLQGLNVVFYPAFSRLNKEAILFILDSVNNSSEIEKILSLYRGMGLSPEFENSTRLKDFKDPRFKALVQYISSIQDRDFYDKLFFGIYDRENLRNIVNSIDDANFVKDYLLNPDYQKIYKNLFKKLADLNIKNVAAENNHLALKLILNKEFNQILTESGIDNISDEDNIIARYYSAIAVSRMIFDGVGGEKIDYDFNDEAGMELIKEVTDTYLEIMKEMLNVVLLDSDTKIYALCNSERVYGRDRFNIDTLQEIIEYMGIQLEIPGENVYRRVGNNKNASKGWLNAIETFVMDSIRTKGYFMFRGHGNENMLWVYDPKENDNGLATGNMLEVITPRELAESLFKLATRDQDPVDLRNITIDLSSCYSYYFARSVYNILEQKFKAENKTESYPTIITAAGLETEFGITDFRGMEGNLHKGINKLLRNFQRGSVSALTLGMVGVSEYMFGDSNITMFSSFFDENMLEKIAKTRESIAKFNISRHRTVETEPDILDNIEQTATRVNIRNVKKIAIRILPKFVTEASIFKEDKFAPIWEELFYRFAPALMLTILISVTMMFAPAGFVLFTKIGFAVILTLFQTIFVKAHIVTDWLRAKDSGGEKSSEEVPETSISDKQSKTVDLGKVFEKDLTFEDKINKIFKTVKERLFAVFSDSKDAESFKIFYKTNKIAAEHKDGLIIPTIAFTIPYVVVMCFFPSIQAVMIATIVSMALHAINNIVAKIIKEKGLLQKKKRDIDFQDIQRRIKHIKLLIENPNVERDLPELKEGSFVLKFGLARKAERRAESLLEYEKIRIFFINRLKDEMAKREEIKAELETIKKARKTKKNKAKIQELEEQLEIMEKEYPRIYNELLFADTKEVEKTIDKIDALLSIFEEIDIILDNIENFKLENADDEDAYKEISALEEDFLDFAENTFMNSLMSLYNNQKTTGIHVRRVVGDSNLIGTKMLSGNNVRMMYKLMLSSILHDIGKNLVPLQILDKQGSFDRLERNIMEFHVVFGGIILRSSILRRLSYTAENHHRYTLKTKMDDLGKETEVGDLHIPTISSLDEEKEEQIERIVKFLEEINPDLSFDSASPYPKSLEDIKSILEDNDMDLTESQQEKLDDLLREVEQIEEEVLIAKIVSLADVFEAVSPKLSFDSERTYQFPQKIRDISSMLENIDIDLTESQKREVIVLLAEIAQIDSEDDAAKKQEMEQKFIKKVLYDRSKSAVIKYVREKNYELIRENAFKIIFTKSPKKIFEELGKTEEEFMADFENDPKGTIDECMSLVDADKFEFDSDVIRAFLEFYFSSEDIRVNNAILESLNKGEENRFIVYIKDALYSLYKLQRSVNRMLVRFTPVIASIFSESQTDYDKYFKDKKVFLQRFKTEEGVKKVRSFEILKFGKSSIQRVIGRFEVPVFERDYDSLGMIVEKDSDGNIVSVKAKEGYGFSSLLIDGEPVGDEKNNLNFSAGQISAMLKDVQILDYDAPDIKEDEMDKYVAHIYLDDSKEDLEKAMEDAIKNNKLMVIHVFRKGFSTKGLTLGQIRDKYDQAYSLLQSDKLKNLPVLSETMRLERDVEVDPYITFDFFLKELLKNHFGHGNFGLFEYPIACYIAPDGSKMVTYDSSLDLGNGRYSSPFLSEEFKNRGITIGVLDDLMKETLIHGDGKGRKMMAESKTRNFEDSRRVDDSKIAGYRFFKATVTLKLETEEQIEAAKQYKKEQDAKARSVTSSSAVDEESGLYSFRTSTSKTSSTVSTATAEDWEDFWSSILKPFGLKLGNYAHVWEEVVFRYLPTAFILLGYMNPLVGLGIQIVFILAHPIGKWMASRMNWEKARKEGKQVGKKAGIGDLFKQIGKDLLLLTPTLVLMLPYVGALLSLAINPALSLIITPAIFTFANVIVQWLTRKDSGGEVISIDKNLVIFITIVSLGSYIFLPLIPVIHPIVNTLINPIVITNAINAGYLHYEYNKRQQDRGKSLNLAELFSGDSEKAKEVVKDGQESDAKSKSEHVKIVADSIDLEGNYEIEEKIKHFRFRKRDLVKFSDDNSFMENEDSFISITLPKGYELSNYGVNKSLSTKDGKIRIKKEKSFKRFIVITDDSKKEHIFFINEEGYREITISLEGKEDVSLKELKDKAGVDIGKDEIVPPKNEVLLKIHDLTVESCSEPFTIELSKEQKNNFIFIRGNFYKISEQGKKEIILKEELEKYGIDLEHSVIENGKIVSLRLILGAKIGVSVRQAVGIDEEEMAYRMEQILGSRDVDSRELITLDEYEEVPTDFVIYFFQVQGLAENVINDIINNISSEGIGATIYPKTLENILITNGFLEEDAKMWVERIFTEYIGDFSNMDISEEIPLDFLRYFLQKEENKNIHGQQDIIKLLSDRGKQISIEDLEQDLLTFGFSKEESVEIINEIKEKNLKIANNFLRKILEQLGLNEEDIEMLNGKGRNLTIKDLEDAFAEQGFDEIKIGEYIEKIKKSFEENMIPGYVSSFLVDKFRELGLNKKAANGRTANIIAKCGDKNSLILLTKLKEELVNDGVSEKEADLWVKQIYENYRASEAKKEKSSGTDGLQISFLKPFIEKKVSERKIVEFFFERTRFISIENLERELIGLGYSKQEAEILIERIRNEYPQQTERFQKIPTDYVISLFKKGFIDKKIVLFLEAGKTTSKEDLEKGFMRYGYSEQESKEIVGEILDQYSKDIRKRNVQIISKYQRERILMRADVSGTDQVISLRIENEQLESTRKVLSNINELDENQLISLLEHNPMLLSMLIEALNRGFVFDKKEIETFGELVEYLQKRKENNEKGDNENIVTLRGYFGEIYLAETTVSGELDGLKLILQLPKNVNEPGIDLIDPVTGMKIQVKIDEGDSTAEAFSKNPTVPIACTNRVAKKKNQPTIRGFVEMETMMGFATSFLGLIYKIGINIIKEEGKNPSYQIVVGGEIKDNVNLTNTSAIIKILNSLYEVEEETKVSDTNAILPENMGLVNRIMQSKFGNAFVVATVIAFKEFKASMKPSFVDMHQSESGRKGAQQLRDFITRFDVVETDGLAARIIKTILGTIVKGASIVKHIAIDYRYIKASGIQEAISMFGNNTYMDEYGQIHIPPVLIVNDLKGLKNLNNTGIKVNGRYIYQVGQKGMLIYGAEGVNSEDISMAVNESQMIKDAIEQMIREKGYEGVSVEVDGVIQEEGDGVRFENGITIIGADELQNKSADYIDGYVSSSIELKRSMGVMYSQKALISLESIDDTEKLRQALKQGRARKIISKAQYDQLQMTYEELMAMREAGIEIYVDSNEIDENLKKAGITGQIIRKDNQIFIHDYYTQEDVEVEEVGENNSLTDIENMLVNSQKLILIDIKVLADKFQKENILGAYKGLNTLIGNIKLKTGIGQLSETDIKSLGYNLDYNKLPQLTLSKPLQEYTKAEIEDMLTASILSMDTNTEIRIILKAIDKNDALKDLFTQIIKERILAKTALTQNYKEFGLRDKKLEILLGQMLFMQMDNKNKAIIDLTYIDSDGTQKEVTGKENDLINKITQDTEKAMRKDEVAINSIIEIILVYGDSYKDKQMAKQLDVNDARNYRAMMAAA